MYVKIGLNSLFTFLGMTESIVAAALSRIGKNVLHLDWNDFYGENWASFNLENLETWIQTMKNFTSLDSQEIVDNFISENENVVKTKINSNVWNVEDSWLCSENQNNEIEKKEDECENTEDVEVHIPDSAPLKWTVDKIKNEYRRFNLDLCPKVCKQ